MSRHWSSLIRALNSLNRSVGCRISTPSCSSHPALCKLGFIHKTIRARRHFDIGYADSQDIDRFGPVQTLLRQLIGFLANRIRKTRF